MATAKAKSKPAARRASKSRESARRSRANDVLAYTPSFLGARRGKLPFDIRGDVLDLDRYYPSEFSEWLDIVTGTDEQECWGLASDVLRHGFKISVKVSPETSLRVTALIASRLDEPVVAAYCTDTERLTFWSWRGKDDLIDDLSKKPRAARGARRQECGTGA